MYGNRSGYPRHRWSDRFGIQRAASAPAEMARRLVIVWALAVAVVFILWVGGMAVAPVVYGRPDPIDLPPLYLEYYLPLIRVAGS